MSGAEQAVICVLMLRGAQTPGELKQRSERMHAFAELVEVQETLQAMIDRGLVVRLERRPGHKEERYAHLLGDPDEDEAASLTGSVASSAHVTAAAGETPPVPAAALAPHEDLRARVSRLEREVAELREALGITAAETTA